MMGRTTKYKVVSLPPYNEQIEQPYQIGETVYRFMRCDYGSAEHDTKSTGMRCISVTRSSAGDYPFSTIPLCCLQLVAGDATTEEGTKQQDSNEQG